MKLKLLYILILFVSVTQPNRSYAGPDDLLEHAVEKPTSRNPIEIIIIEHGDDILDSYEQDFIDAQNDAANQSPPVLVRVIAAVLRGAAVGSAASLSFYASTHDISTINITELMLSREFWGEYGNAGIVGGSLSGTLSAFNNELQNFYDDKNRIRAILKSFSVEYIYIVAIVSWSQFLEHSSATNSVIPVTALSLALQGFWGQTFGEIALASATRKVKKKYGKVRAELTQALSDGVVLFLSSSTVGAQILILSSKPGTDAYNLGISGLVLLTAAGISAYGLNLYHDKLISLEGNVLKADHQTDKTKPKVSSWTDRCKNLFRKSL